MKNRLTILMMAALSATLIFASCKKEEGEGQTNQNEKPITEEFSFQFKDMVDWEPKSIYVGYYTDIDTSIMVMLSRDEKTAEEIVMEMDEFDVGNYPDGIAVFEFPAKKGTISGELDPMMDDPIAYSMVLLGSESYGTQQLPVVWFSSSYTVSVSVVDFVNNKLSATFNASMQDMISAVMGMDSEIKPMSLVMNNYPMQNFDILFEEDLSKVRKMLDR